VVPGERHQEHSVTAPAGRFVSATDVPREAVPQGTLGWHCRPREMNAKDLVVIEATLAPGQGHAFHRHPDQEEVLYVLEGRIEQWLEREHRLLGPGDSIFIPRNIVHASFNALDREARFLAILGPSVSDAGYVAIDVSEDAPWRNLRRE
jgi:quercetin dioxygenase-like cupin family protein